MGNLNFFRLDFEKPGQRGNRLARQVHEGLWRKQPHGLAADDGSGDLTKIALIKAQGGSQLTGEGIYPPKAGVMTCGFIFSARVAQADEEFDHAKKSIVEF